MLKKAVKIFSAFVFIAGSLSASALAQDINVQADVSSNKIPIGSTAKLNITISGTQDAHPPQTPDIEGIDIRYLGPSRRVSIVNNSYSSSIVFSYSLFGVKEGDYQIPVIDVSVNGQTFKTAAIPIQVVDSSASTSTSPGKPAGQKAPASLNDKIFLVLKTAQKEVYVNERVPVKVLLYFSDQLPVSDIQYPAIDNLGFFMEEFSDYKQYKDIVKGIKFNVVEFNTSMYPTRTGDVVFGPAKLQCNLLIPNQSRRSALGGFDNFFNDDFFNGFFGNYEKRPITLESSEVDLTVLSLPSEGRPQDFSNAVGQFTFDVTASPKEVKVGDPITVKMSVSGTGNLEAITMPKIKAGEDFKLYDPIVKQTDGKKILEQVLVPKNADVHEIPPISFSYFDVLFKKYQTIIKGPFPIKVDALKKGENLKVVGLQPEPMQPKPEKLGKDIVFIKDDIGALCPLGQRFYKGMGFYFGIFLFFVLWASSYFFYEWTHRLETDIVFARKLQAPKTAKKGLALSQKFLAQGKKQEFYDTLFKTLQNYLGHKLHLSSGAITFSTLTEHLSAGEVEETVLKNIEYIFQQCDMVRYAAAQIKDEDMRQSYQKAQSVIEYLERRLK